MKNIYEVKITKQAQEHIRDIFDYIVNELLATGAANNLMDKMHKTIASLNQNPKRFQLIDEEPWKNMGIRKVVVNHFLVYYWIDEENMKVQIIAVMSERRDQLNELSKISF